MLELSADRFEELVADALDGIPTELLDLLDNVVIQVEDDAPDHEPGLLGLYEGVPLTERGGWYSGQLPDRIRIFRWPILSVCETYEQIIEQVRITVVHEIAHHFGIDDDRLHDLGYG